MGRTRLGRFAAVTVPAAAMSVGLGLAIVQGAVSATLSSADGFDLKSDGMTADKLAMAPGAVDAAPLGGNATATALSRVEGASLDKMCVGVNQALPVSILGIDRLGLDVISNDPTVELENVDLNSSDLTAGSSSLNNTSIGVAQSETAFAGTSAPSTYAPNGFALTSNNVSLANLDSTAYAVTLSGGLSLNSMTVKASLPSSATTPTCAGF